ncbi:hypothetical protein SAMN05421676_102210 [Salinibacillus kushneri]|uniref:Uncharacterized protein n=1 Tax=Salinibacillus kushneri TaxID=237682 RepID=A0A1I0ANL6_9BACI|nr:hypothetical protein [Salinibacillus kushneri]SES95761.1 hypothetical protein SAMN05421676_102210 [Salinibacillus kushneri]
MKKLASLLIVFAFILFFPLEVLAVDFTIEKTQIVLIYRKMVM